MTNEHKRFLLALYPTTRGYCYILFENGLKPVDWCVRDVRCKAEERNALALVEIEALLEKSRPERVVLEDVNEKECRRSDRIKELTGSIAGAAKKRGIRVEVCTRRDVMEVFAPLGATKKYEIAELVAKQFPAFGHRLPRERYMWESEQPVMGLFAAGALGMVAMRED